MPALVAGHMACHMPYGWPLAARFGQPYGQPYMAAIWLSGWATDPPVIPFCKVALFGVRCWGCVSNTQKTLDPKSLPERFPDFSQSTFQSMQKVVTANNDEQSSGSATMAGIPWESPGTGIDSLKSGEPHKDLTTIVCPNRRIERSMNLARSQL